MGMHRVCNLKVEDSDRKVIHEAAELWVRDGTRQVEVVIDDKIISIPQNVIYTLLAADYTSSKISELEQMDTATVINKMFGSEFLKPGAIHPSGSQDYGDR